MVPSWPWVAKNLWEHATIQQTKSWHSRWGRFMREETWPGWSAWWGVVVSFGFGATTGTTRIERHLCLGLGHRWPKLYKKTLPSTKSWHLQWGVHREEAWPRWSEWGGCSWGVTIETTKNGEEMAPWHLVANTLWEEVRTTNQQSTFTVSGEQDHNSQCNIDYQ